MLLDPPLTASLVGSIYFVIAASLTNALLLSYTSCHCLHCPVNHLIIVSFIPYWREIKRHVVGLLCQDLSSCVCIMIYLSVDDQTYDYKSSVLLQIKCNGHNIKLMFYNQVRY